MEEFISGLFAGITVALIILILITSSLVMIKIYIKRKSYFEIYMRRADKARKTYEGELILNGFTKELERHLLSEITELEKIIRHYHSIKISKKRESKLNDIINRLYNSRSELIELQEQIKNRA